MALAMFENSVNLVISVDTETNTIRFCADNMNRKEIRAEETYFGRPFGEEFYQKLDEMMKAYQEQEAQAAAAAAPAQTTKLPYVNIQKAVAKAIPKVTTRASIILPDTFFLMDTVNVPTIGKKAMENAVEVGIGAIYKNKKDFHYRWFPLSQNKQVATFGVVGTRKDILDRLQDICNDNQVGLQTVSFAANAMACGAMAFNPKLRTGTGLVLDVQENACRFAFVNKGRVIGAYHLPFGMAMLCDSQLVSEESLFDYSSGKMLVQNAWEKAKNKSLAALGEEAALLELEDGQFGGKKVTRRTARVRTRELPIEPEDFVYENFRVILKWTLSLLKNNPTIIAQGEIDTVYMNIGPEYEFLFEKINGEEEENGVKFVPVFLGNRQEAVDENLRELEMFGGYQLAQFGKFNNF